MSQQQHPLWGRERSKHGRLAVEMLPTRWEAQHVPTVPSLVVFVPFFALFLIVFSRVLLVLENVFKEPAPDFHYRFLWAFIFVLISLGLDKLVSSASEVWPLPMCWGLLSSFLLCLG